MLIDLIKKEYIQTEVEALDWKDAIKKAAVPLIEDKAINKTYVESMINAAKEFGPYFVITKGIALPHAANENTVFKNAISISVLKDSVRFGHEFNDPVKIIFMLAAKNNTEHLDSLSHLANLLSDDDFIKLLYNCQNQNEIYDYIKEKENEDA